MMRIYITGTYMNTSIPGTVYSYTAGTCIDIQGSLNKEGYVHLLSSILSFPLKTDLFVLVIVMGKTYKYQISPMT